MFKPTTWLQNRVRLIIEIHTQLKRCHRRKNVKCVIINCRYERTRMRVGLPRYSGILLLNCIIMSVRCKIEILRVGDESANKSKIWGRNFALKNGTFRFWVCKILLRASERKKKLWRIFRLCGIGAEIYVRSRLSFILRAKNLFSIYLP